MAAHKWAFDHLYLFLISTIGFLVPENVNLATGIRILCHLEAEILKNEKFQLPMFKNSRWPPINVPLTTCILF